MRNKSSVGLPPGAVLSLAGAVAALLGGLAMTMFGPSLTVLFRVLVATPDQTPPALGQPMLLSLAGAALYGVGWTLGLWGLRASSDVRPPTILGRGLIAATAAPLILASLVAAFGVLTARNAFAVIAQSAAAPRPEELELMTQGVGPILAIGFGVALAAPLLLSAAACLGFDTAAESRSAGSPAPWIAVGVAGAATLLMVLFALLVYLNAAQVEAMLTSDGATPRPSDLAESMSAMLTFSLLQAGGFLFLAAASVVLAFTMPGRK